MPRFPKSQAQIAALAEQLSQGLLDNNAIFSQPPANWVRGRRLVSQSKAKHHLQTSPAARNSNTESKPLMSAVKASRLILLLLCCKDLNITL